MGCTQRRERMILVGTKEGYKYQFPHPTHGPDSKKNSYVGAFESMEDIQDPNEPLA